MATPYSDIYDVFQSKITDYSFLNLDITDVENIFKKWLKSASIKFKACKKNLSDRDESAKQFNENLTEEEIEILSCLMVYEWTNDKVFNIELLKQHLSHKDYRIYSQANHLEKVKELRNGAKTEAQQLIIAYSYDTDLSDLR